MQNTTLIRVLGALGACYLAALVGLFTLYRGDQVVALAALSAAFGVITSGLLSLRNAGAIQEVHTIVNSQKTLMLAEIADLKAALSVATDVEPPG